MKNLRIFAAFALTLLPWLASGQSLDSRTLVHDGNVRDFSIYVPASYDMSQSTPLLFNFHGGSGNIAGQVATSDMRPIADTAGFILVYPQALPDPNDGGSTNWTHKDPTTVDDIYFVAAMIDTLSTEFNIDPERVYACGYSNGGEFSFELACRLSSRIAAIGVVARSMYYETHNNCAPSHPTGVLSIHGTADEYDGISFAGFTYYISLDDANAYWAGFNNTDASPVVTQVPDLAPSDGSTVEHHVWANGDGCVSVEHFKVLGGGHDWPGTFGNMDIDASEEIWNFVSRYTVNGLIGCTVAAPGPAEAASAWTLVPNPVRDQLSLVGDLQQAEPVRIYSPRGEVVLEAELRPGQQDIWMADLAPGLYLVEVGGAVFKVLKVE